MTLVEPWWLLAIPPGLLLLWWIHRRSRHPMSAARRRAGAALRMLALVLVLVALAAPLWHGSTSRRVVVAVLDHSVSLGEGGWQRSRVALERCLAGLPDGVEYAVVSAGEEPQLLLPLGTDRDRTLPPRPMASERSDLADALRLAAGLVSAEASGRLLVIGDGLQTRGRAEQVAREAASRGLRIDAIPVPGDSRPDVRIAALRSSHTRIHQGATLALQIECVGNLSGTGQLALFENGIEVETAPVTVAAGEPELLTFRRRPDRRGVTTYRAVLRGFPADELPANNQALAYVDVRGEPVALCLSSAFDELRHLQRAAAAEGIRLDLREPRAMPGNVAELLGYDAVVIANVPAQELGEQRMGLLRDYVEQLGGGLVVIGGDSSFGAGGYYRTPLEEVLPVKMRARDKEERRPTALMLVLDRSGSMGGDKIQLCKAAAQTTAQMLQSKDYLGVIAFDSSAHRVVPMAPVGPAAISAIDGISADGGTDIHAGMVAGWDDMRGVSAGARHMIVLSDGHGSGGDIPALVAGMRSEGISVSAVAVGSGADTALLQGIASQGGGTYYENTAPADLKAIFTQDAMRHLGKIVREEPFSPVVSEDHPMLAGWQGDAPPLLGYVKTERRAASQVPLVTDLGDPLLAHWRFGLGKVTAFTSGCGSRWAPLWIAGWPGYGPFWTQVLRDTMRPPQGQLLDVHLADTGEEARIRIDLLSDAMSFANEVPVEATVFHLPAGGLGASISERHRLECRQEAPGRYAARFPLDADGVWVVQVRAGARLASAGLVHAGSGEAALGVVDRALLEALVAPSGGVLLAPEAVLPPWEATRHAEQRIDLRPWLLIATILILLFDTVLRRWENVQGLTDMLHRR